MNKPVWLLEKEKTKYPQLTENINTEVAIIGGGLAGIFCAYLLAKTGKKVIVVERNNIGSGQTSYTTAFITYVVDITLTKLVERFGEEKAKLIWEAGQTAITEIERIVLQEKIECDFRRCAGYEFALNKEDSNTINKDAELGQKFGFNVSFKNDRKLEFKNFGYLEIKNQAKFHPLKFLSQLAKKAKEVGAVIFENTEVLDIKGKNPVRIKTKESTVEAEYVIVDTYNPINSQVLIPSKLISHQSYVISLLVKKNFIEEAIYWDTEEPYNYFRLDSYKNFDRLILGGRDHLTGGDPNPKKHFNELEKYFKKIFGRIEYDVENTWTGEILEPADGIAYIGRSPLSPSILISTGFSGNGMTYSAISAMINKDIIMKNNNKYKDLFNPARMGGAGEIAKQGASYIQHIVTQPFSKKVKLEEEKIPPDSGKVIKIKGKKVAVYKDKKGKIHKLSPVCQHLGCTVGWNNAAKTWDCPCHGSRYLKDGSVLNGPTKKPLKKL